MDSITSYVVFIVISIACTFLSLTLYLFLNVTDIVVELTARITAIDGLKTNSAITFITVPKLNARGIEIMYQAKNTHKLLRYAITDKSAYFSNRLLGLIIILLTEREWPVWRSLKVIDTPVVTIATNQLPILLNEFDKRLV